MTDGLLWFDDSATRTLLEKVQRAARQYRQKFGGDPNACKVNQSESTDCVLGGFHIIPAKNVLPNHFFIGVENEA